MVRLGSRLPAAFLLLASLHWGAAESPGCGGAGCLEDAALLQMKRESASLRTEATRSSSAVEAKLGSLVCLWRNSTDHFRNELQRRLMALDDETLNGLMGRMAQDPVPKDDEPMPKDDEPMPKDDEPISKDDEPMPKDDEPMPKDDLMPKDDGPVSKEVVTTGSGSSSSYEVMKAQKLVTTFKASISNDLEAGIQGDIESDQKVLLEQVAAFSACASTMKAAQGELAFVQKRRLGSMEAVRGTKGGRSLLAYQSCVSEEKVLKTEVTTCKTQMAEISQNKTRVCSTMYFDGDFGTHAQCSCDAAAGESYADYLSRQASKYQTLHQQLQQSQTLCETYTQQLLAVTTECESKSEAFSQKQTECIEKEAKEVQEEAKEVQESTEDREVAIKSTAACQAYSSCYEAAKSALADLQASVKVKQANRLKEWNSTKTLDCFMRDFNKSGGALCKTVTQQEPCEVPPLPDIDYVAIPEPEACTPIQSESGGTDADNLVDMVEKELLPAVDAGAEPLPVVPSIPAVQPGMGGTGQVPAVQPGISGGIVVDHVPSIPAVQPGAGGQGSFPAVQPGAGGQGQLPSAWAALIEAPEDVLVFVHVLVSQSQDISVAFTKIDGSDGDGLLTLGEFQVGVIGTLHIQKFQGADEEQRIANIFGYLDADGDGKVSTQEWAVLEVLSHDMQQSIVQLLVVLEGSYGGAEGDYMDAAWKAFDADMSGLITEVEWSQTILVLKRTYAGPSLVIFRILDADGDGGVSRAEFYNLELFRPNGDSLNQDHSSRSKCCLCGNGDVVYSRTGLCKNCDGAPDETTDATEKCQMLSPGFIDDSAECTASCRDTMSKCCLCGNGEVVYSRTGSCKNCDGKPDETTVATDKCQMLSPGFIDDSAECTASCRDSMTSKCCLCGNGEVVYSRTGSCKNCDGKPDETTEATDKCQMLSPGFIDDSAECTASCRDSMTSKCCLCGNGDFLYSRTGTCKKCQGGIDYTADATQKCQMLSSEFIDDSSKCTASCKDSIASKCCKCGNGDVVFSKSGSCKNCNGKPDKTYIASSKCQWHSKKFIDSSSKCTASCKSLVAGKR